VHAPGDLKRLKIYPLVWEKSHLIVSVLFILTRRQSGGCACTISRRLSSKERSNCWTSSRVSSTRFAVRHFETAGAAFHPLIRYGLADDEQTIAT
jgi:hypothetical protein